MLQKNPRGGQKCFPGNLPLTQWGVCESKIPQLTGGYPNGINSTQLIPQQIFLCMSEHFLITSLGMMARQLLQEAY